MKIVYRRREKSIVYEIGQIDLPVETNRTGVPDWCNCRICETWNERDALRIVNALQKVEDES